MKTNVLNEKKLLEFENNVFEFCERDGIQKTCAKNVIKAVKNKTFNKLNDSDKFLLWDIIGCYGLYIGCLKNFYINHAENLGFNMDKFKNENI